MSAGRHAPPVAPFPWRSLDDIQARLAELAFQARQGRSTSALSRTMDTPAFVPTEAEQSFVLAFCHETFNHPDELSAVSWLNSHGLHWNLLAAFQRWQVTHDPECMSKIDSQETLPPFRLPWGSPSEFLDRVEASLVAYPDLRSLMKGLMAVREPWGDSVHS
jgi:hypothetical protein